MSFKLWSDARAAQLGSSQVSQSQEEHKEDDEDDLLNPNRSI